MFTAAVVVRTRGGRPVDCLLLVRSSVTRSFSLFSPVHSGAAAPRYLPGVHWLQRRDDSVEYCPGLQSVHEETPLEERARFPAAQGLQLVAPDVDTEPEAQDEQDVAALSEDHEPAGQAVQSRRESKYLGGGGA